MNTCENCELEHDGTFGSGRFCSTKCARGFSTKVKRNEINEKVRAKLTGTGNADVIKPCSYCKKEFTVSFLKRAQPYCSISCGVKDRDVVTRANISAIMSVKYAGEGNPMFGRTPTYKQSVAVWSTKNNVDVVIRSSYEQKAVEILEADPNVLWYDYESLKIPYLSEKGTERNYIPDFVVHYRDGSTAIVEVKPERVKHIWGNDLKFKAGMDYAAANKVSYVIWSESELGL